MNSQDLISIAPFGIVAGGACVMLIFYLLNISSFVRPFVFTMTLILALFASAKQGMFNELSLSSTYYLNSQSSFFSILLIFSTIFSSFLSFGQLEKQGVKSSLEIDLLYLFALAGGLLMVCTANLLVLFVGFELLSICVYALCGIASKERASAESALKYFLLGAFSSAFLLYGMALVYGATGSFNYEIISSRANASSPLLLLGVSLLIFGFAFKVSLVPFHFWTPDVYQGAPTSVTAFMAVVVKLSAFIGFLRLFSSAFYFVPSLWLPLLWLLTVLSMTVGNLMAIQQKSIKRMLAYSSIAHSGYMAMGFIAFGSNGFQASVYYLIVYAMMTIVSFGCLILATTKNGGQYEKDSIDSLNGLGWSRPWLGFAMAVSMFALAGMPPLVGFLGKVYLFTSVIEGGFYGLAIIAALNSVISLYYYLKVIVAMYFKESTVDVAIDRDLEVNDVQEIFKFFPAIAVIGATAAVVLFGFFSQPLFGTVSIVFR